MVFTRLYLLPILIGLIFPVTFAITYIISTVSDRVYPFFPYVSDTGTWAPESCFFGQMVNLGALCMAASVYVRYLLIIDVCNKNVCKKWIKKYNRISAGIGYVAVLGVSVVANFQETNLFVIHIIGAMLAFGIGSIYFGIQALISFGLKQFLGNKYINILRLVLFIIILISMNLTAIPGIISYLEFDGDDITKWTKDNKGHTLHIISSFSEWILVMSVVFYLFSYIYEFRHVTIETPKLRFSTNQ